MLKIESFSLLIEAKTPKIESDVFEANGHKWRLDLYPNGNDEENKGSHISLYAVICDTESCLKGWEVCVDVCFFVYDHIHHNYVTIQDTNGRGTRFHEKKTTCGFDKLIPMESFMESTNGFLFNDSCVFGAEVITVPVPKFTQLDRCLSMIKPLATKNTHTWTINNFSAVTESVLYSEIFKVGNVKWHLELYPEGNNIGEGTHLSIYLAVHDAASFADGWKVYAKFKICVKSEDAENDMEGECDAWFHNSALGWGFPSLILLSELIDPEKGYLLNDNLIVKVDISVMGTLRYFI
ncbi:putative ubiquitinyl hydrolase 1 [Helianthus annuus]|nr:putative ubiquitinyl hydrolase 1 [Helianthus annuus]